jgi:uncharacterized protein
MPDMTSVFINELHYDNIGTDTGEAIEIVGPAGIDLAGWSVVLYNGANGQTYGTARTLSGILADQGGGFGTAVLAYPTDGIQNGSPDGIALVDPDGNVVQFLSYEGVMTAANGPAAGMTSVDIGVAETASTPVGHSLQLTGTGATAGDFTWAAAGPESFGALNGGQVFTGGGVSARINEFHYDNAGADVGERIEIRVTAGTDLEGWTVVLYNGSNGATYSPLLQLSAGTVTSGGDGFDYVTLDAPGLQNGAPDGFALVDPDGQVVEFLSYEGAMVATNGPAAGMTSVDVGVAQAGTEPVGSSLQRSDDGASWFATLGENSFGAPNGTDDEEPEEPGEPTPLLISQIQGSGSASPVVGEYVLVSAIVTYTVGNGFFLQEEDADSDGDDLTSEGIFVFTGGSPNVAVGDLVELAGNVVEFNGLTEITEITDLVTVSGGNALPAYTEIVLPSASADIFERVEGMRVSLVSDTEAPITVVENFNFGRFGEIVVSAGSQTQPTQIYDPQDEAAEIAALQAANSLNRLTIDDGVSAQNPIAFSYVPVPAAFDNGNGFLDSGDEFTAAGPTIRLGAEMAAPVEGVMTYQFGGYAMLVDGTLPIDEATNGGARPQTVDLPESDVTVASFNVLNYFTTLGSRGATTEADLARQTDKIVAAMLEIGADVFGVQEIENNGFGEGSAMRALVDALNAEAAARGLDATYAFVDPTGRGSGIVGTDQITTGFIYDTRTLTLGVSDYFVFDDGVSQLNRPAVAASFTHNETGESFNTVVNHFKSKGQSGINDPADPNFDQGDGQGFWNAVRTDAANQLAAWIATDPTGSGDPDYLLLGDLNAYAKEDPVQALIGAGYVDLIDAFIGQENAYSYVFDGQRGVLDHALATGSLADQVTGVAEWHINADEPGLLSYSTQFNDPGFYNDDPFASSDHDPVVVGLNLGGSGGEPEPSAGFELVGLNDWFNPAWGGGFNAAFTYTVQEADLVDGEVYAWEILPGYDGPGTITTAWTNGFNGAVGTGPNAEGAFVLTTAGQSYKPKLEAGDVIGFSVQVQGAGFDEADFAFAFADIDRVPSGDDALMVSIDAAPTNDWGSGLNQSVTIANMGGERIDSWSVELDVPDGVDIRLTSVWGASVTTDADGDLIFTALDWNGSIGAGGSVGFGFNATYSGVAGLSFEDDDFMFLQGVAASQDMPMAA